MKQGNDTDMDLPEWVKKEAKKHSDDCYDCYPPEVFEAGAQCVLDKVQPLIDAVHRVKHRAETHEGIVHIDLMGALFEELEIWKAK